MKTPVLTNVHVDNLSPINTRCSVGWEYGGFRFHYWTTLETKTPAFSQHTPAVLYKNCARNLKTGAPGHFHTRALDPSSTANAAMIREAIRFADERMLWTEAVSDLHKKQAREHADNAAAAERRRKHDAGPQLYEALKLARATLNAKGGCTAAERDHATLCADAALLMAETDNEANRSD